MPKVTVAALATRIALRIMGVCFGLAPIDLGTIVSDLPAADVVRRLESMPAWRRPDLTAGIRWSPAARRLSEVSSRRFGTMHDRAVVSIETAGAGSCVHAIQVPNSVYAVMAVVAMGVSAVLSWSAVSDPTRMLIGLAGLCCIRLIFILGGRRGDARRFTAVLSAACDPRLELPPSL